MAVALAELMGFAVSVAAPCSDHGKFTGSPRLIDGFVLPVGDDRADYIVVPTQGAGDAAALMAALSIDARYVAFVGSRKKAACAGFCVSSAKPQAHP